MDVLYVIKSDHELIKMGFSRLEAADGVKSRRLVFDELARVLQVHLSLARDYLYPEINGLFPGSEALIDIGLAQATIIGKKLKALSKLTVGPASEQVGYAKRVIEVRDTVLAHLASEENLVLPRMRDLIRTEDREDLGEVFEDAQAEIRRQLEEPVSPVAVSRKRA